MSIFRTSPDIHIIIYYGVLFVARQDLGVACTKNRDEIHAIRTVSNKLANPYEQRFIFYYYHSSSFK